MNFNEVAQIMNSTLNKLFIAAALACLALSACEKAQVTQDYATYPGAFAQYGNTTCMLVDNKVFCMPSKMGAPMRLAVSTAL